METRVWLTEEQQVHWNMIEWRQRWLRYVELAQVLSATSCIIVWVSLQKMASTNIYDRQALQIHAFMEHGKASK